MKYKEKLELAEQIIEELKEEIFFVIWYADPVNYGSEKNLLPWIEEDAEYLIRKLKLNTKDEKNYLEKIHQVFGEYSEVIPLLRKRRL